MKRVSLAEVMPGDSVAVTFGPDDRGRYVTVSGTWVKHYYSDDDDITPNNLFIKLDNAVSVVRMIHTGTQQNLASVEGEVRVSEAHQERMDLWSI